MVVVRADLGDEHGAFVAERVVVEVKVLEGGVPVEGEGQVTDAFRGQAVEPGSGPRSGSGAKSQSEQERARYKSREREREREKE